MSREGHTPEQTIQKSRQAEVESAQGATVGVVCKRIEVTQQTKVYPSAPKKPRAAWTTGIGTPGLLVLSSV